jgi:hypothetical protein
MSIIVSSKGRSDIIRDEAVRHVLGPPAFGNDMPATKQPSQAWHPAVARRMGFR